MSRVLNQHTFRPTELLQNLEIKKLDDGRTLVKIINNCVNIILELDIYGTGNVELFGFYKKTNETRIGTARCALLFALQHIVKNKKDIQSNLKPDTSTIRVSSPSPDDGNMNRLVKMYTDMGFQLKDPQPGIPIVLECTINELISKLNAQCKADPQEGGKPVRKSLDKCTVKELKAMATKRGINVSGLKKADIIGTLRK